MTYKRIVQYMIERSADEWVRSLLKDHGIDFKWTNVKVKEMDNCDKDNMLWACKVTVVLPDYRKVNLLVGGSADDMVGICNSVIWNEDERHQVIWFNVESTRHALGITDFKVA